MTVETLGADWDSGPDAFVDTAAVMAALDLVIASDTSIVHLAGALGRPVWLVLKRSPDWRWMLDRTDSPWYPTARLFRQCRPGDWDEVFERVAAELARAVAPVREPDPASKQGIDTTGSWLHSAIALHQEGRLGEAAQHYAAILDVEPTHFDALHLLGVARHQQDRQSEALDLIRSALRLQPANADALANLGLVLKKLGRPEEALASYDRALAIRPDFADALNNRGNMLKELKRPEEALASYDEALAIRPELAEILNNSGSLLRDLHRPQEALARYDRALAIRPDFAEALNNRGIALQDLGRPAEALASYDKALAIRPDYAEALNNRGIALQALERPDEALASYDKALTIRPDYAEALNNRGSALQALTRPEEALASYDRALAIQPDYAEALNNRGNMLQKLGRLDEAVASYDRALAIRPDHAEALSNRGAALHDLNRPEEALASYDRALAIRPDYPEAFNNRGVALHELRRPEEAIASFEQALALRPDYAEAHFGRSLVLLLRGEYAEGWREFEWRWKGGTAEKMRPRDFAEPQWQGEDVSGKTLLLHAEQGFGDTLQFCRYAALIDATARVILEVPRPLVRLCSSLPGIAGVVAAGDPLPAFDLHCPLLSLPRAFGTTVETIPGKVPYLTADPEQVAAWRERLDALPGCLRVGLVWAGSPRPSFRSANAIDRRRSTTLAQFAPLAAVPGASFVSLQKGAAAEQTRSSPPGLVIHDWTDELQDFADTAALIEALDLVISVDTSVVHLAGALAKPVWIVNRFDSCWRWMLDREDSPWYPTARLFRQRRRGDWDEMIGRMAAELARIVAGTGQLPAPPEPAAKRGSDDADTRVQRGLALHQEGRIEEAALHYAAVLDAQPDHFDALHLLGVVRFQQDRDAEGLDMIRSALRLQPTHAEALSNAGLVLGKMGRIAEALASFDQALAIRPDYAEALNNRGNVLHSLGRIGEALASYDRALAIRPDYAEALNNRGSALRDLKRPEEALASYDRAMAIWPDNAEAFNNRGTVLQDLDRAAEALASYDKALAIQPDYAAALNNRGVALQNLKRLDEALASYDRALAVSPAYADALSNRGSVLQDLRRPEEALASFDQALAIRPDYPEALHNRGNVLHDLQRPGEAVASYDKALALRPNYAEALNNRGSALHDLQRSQEALASCNRALAIRPDYPEARFDRGIIALATGDFPAGWAGYEQRWNLKEAPPRKLVAPYPAWKGEDLRGKRIIVYEEQGLGDVIQFSRFLLRLAALGAGVTFLVRASMHRLLRALAPAIRLADTHPAGEVFDFQCALLSLPSVLGTTLDTVPADIPYLVPEAPLVAAWQRRIGHEGVKIGIAWQGNPTSKADIGRSFPLRCYRPVAAIPGVRLISLQKTHGAAQLASLPAGMTVETLGADWDSGPDAFVDTAAVMAALDLVIAPDSAIAHLAGAMGRPVWVVLKAVPDWRWMLDRANSPWYPTARLYRQRRRGDWDEVFERIAAGLAQFCSGAELPLR